MRRVRRKVEEGGGRCTEEVRVGVFWVEMWSLLRGVRLSEV